MSYLFFLSVFFLNSSLRGQSHGDDLGFLKLEDVFEQALKEDKRVILVFQGLDWCGPCIRLENEIWQNKAFQKKAADRYLIYKADFPKSKKNALSKAQHDYNIQLADHYNPQYLFPYVVLMRPNGQIVGITGYKAKTPKAYFQEIERFFALGR